MSRRLLYFDLEGTGVDPLSDRIVEIHATLIEGGGMTVLASLVNPGRPIPPDSRDIAERVQAMVTDSILIGYSNRKYDVPLIDAELRRAGQPGLARDARGRFTAQEIDLYEVWCQSEPRSLVGAARRFAHTDLENAHSADADAQVLPAVMLGMIYAFNLGDAEGGDWWGRTLDRLIERSRPAGALDRDGKFVVRADGVIVFNFGQSRGRSVASDPGLLEWILRKDFSPDTKAVAIELLDQIERERHEFVEEDEGQGVLL